MNVNSYSEAAALAEGTVLRDRAGLVMEARGDGSLLFMGVADYMGADITWPAEIIALPADG